MSKNRLPQSPIALPLVTAVLLLFAGCSDSPEKLLERAQQRIQDRDFIGAYIYFQDFMEQFPDDPLMLDVMYGMAMCHERLGEFADARKVYTDIGAQYGGEVEDITFDTQSRVGMVFFYEGKMEEGRAACREIADASAPVKFRMNAYGMLAHSYIQEASFSLARGIFDEAIAAAVLYASDVPDASAAVMDVRDSIRFQQAQTWVDEGDRVQAANVYSSVADDTTSSDVQRALAMYKAAESLDYAYRVETWVDEETGEEKSKGDRNTVLAGEEHDRVLSAYKRVYETYPNNDYALWARMEAARILQDDGEQDEADALLKKTVELYNGIIAKPIDENQIKWAMSKIGDCYLRLERQPEARAAFLRLYRQYPDDPAYAQVAQARVMEIDRFLAGETASSTATIDASTASDGTDAQSPNAGP